MQSVWLYILRGRQHLKIHSGEKSNKCYQCNYTSSCAGNLRRHLKTHSGEKSNKCNQCDFTSSEAGNLRKHLKTHIESRTNKARSWNQSDLVSECDISVSKLLGFETIPIVGMVSVSVSKIFDLKKKYRYRFRKKLVSKKSIGMGFEKFWYRKKYWYRFRKILVSEKVSDSVSKKFGIGKKFRIRFRSDFGFRHTLSSMWVISDMPEDLQFFQMKHEYFKLTGPATDGI